MASYMLHSNVPVHRGLRRAERCEKLQVQPALSAPATHASRSQVFANAGWGSTNGANGYSFSGVKKDLMTSQQMYGRNEVANTGTLEIGQQTTVRFSLKYKTNYGQSVRLLGSHPKLGAWDLRKAVELKWTEGDQWVANVQLPAGGIYEYKYVLIDYQTKQAIEWQNGSNAVLALVASETEVNVFDNWGNNPGANVQVNSQSLTREDKLQAWSKEMIGYWKESRRLQIELAHQQAEGQGLRAEVSQLRMELSLEKQQRKQAEAKVQELTIENAQLRSQLVNKTLELNKTLAEVVKLLDQELEDDEYADEDEWEYVEDGEEGEEVMSQEEQDNSMTAQAFEAARSTANVSTY